MGRLSKSKGKRGEREIVALARAAGLPAERTWHLAQSPSEPERCCDVRICGQPYQVKRSRDGFGALYDALEHVAGLFVRADGRGWLVVVRAEDYLRLLRADKGETAQAEGRSTTLEEQAQVRDYAKAALVCAVPAALRCIGADAKRRGKLSKQCLPVVRSYARKGYPEAQKILHLHAATNNLPERKQSNLPASPKPLP